MNTKLKNWIAEAESLQTFFEFDLPKENLANYTFMSNYVDFYFGLVNSALEYLEENRLEDTSESLLGYAKGLEIFSLKDTANIFRGIDPVSTLILSAAFQYLAGYNTSALCLTKSIVLNNPLSTESEFLLQFLSKKLTNRNNYSKKLIEFFSTGNEKAISTLIQELELKESQALNFDAENYLTCKISLLISKKISKDNLWLDLSKLNPDKDHWKDLVNYYSRKNVPIWSLFPSQKSVIDKGITQNKTFSIQMPTSSGKTSVCEIAIYDEFKRDPNCKILYLAPFRALAAELKTTLAKSLRQLNIKSKIVYGGNFPTPEDMTSIEEANLVISTPEKFLAIEEVIPGLHNEFGTVICDEGHLLDDLSRGLSYELLLSRLKQSSKKKRFLFISAIIPNISTINNWLGGDESTLISSEYRPTKLHFAFLNLMKNQKGYYLDVNPTDQIPIRYKLYKFIYTNDLNFIDPTTQKKIKLQSKKSITIAVVLKALNMGSTALFCPHKRGNLGVEDLAEETIKQLRLKQSDLLSSQCEAQYLLLLNEYFELVFGTDYLLTNCSNHGFLYHHGDFHQSIREIIEDAIRTSKIKLVICTNTLAEGVNLPIKTIVIHSTKRYNPKASGNYETIKIRDLKNLVGRAGRAGKETKGFVIIPHSSDQLAAKNLITNTSVEPVTGRLFQIASGIKAYLVKKRIEITPEVLDSFNEEFQSLMDDIDLSILDLLAEEVNSEQLKIFIQKLVEETLSYFQANEAHKETLTQIFMLRANKIEPFIENNLLSDLKSSGASIRLFNELTNHFDFSNAIWTKEFDALDEEWLTYILDHGLLQLESYLLKLTKFNEERNTNFTPEHIKLCILLWLNGSWYESIANEIQSTISKTLLFLNNFIIFTTHNYISKIIRIYELKNGLLMTDSILNWPICLQNGLNSALQASIFELGLIDRPAIISLSYFLKSSGYTYESSELLKSYLAENKKLILDEIRGLMPQLSYEKLVSFFRNI